MKRILIAIPCMDTVQVSFTSSLSLMLMHSMQESSAQDYACGIHFHGTSILPMGRQILAKLAVGLDFDYILYIDTDMTFPRNMMDRLIAHNKPIIGINAMSRHKPYKCTAHDMNDVAIRTTHESTGLERVKRTGFGIIWIDTEVFKKMPQPWFMFDWIEEKQHYKGEDYFFCDKARDLGYEIWIDHDLSKEVYHMGPFGWTPTMRPDIEKEIETLKETYGRTVLLTSE